MRFETTNKIPQFLSCHSILLRIVYSHITYEEENCFSQFLLVQSLNLTLTYIAYMTYSRNLVPINIGLFTINNSRQIGYTLLKAFHIKTPLLANTINGFVSRYVISLFIGGR